MEWKRKIEIEIANKIGWDKMMEKDKETQKNGTSTINLKEDF
jgi:hypothetical protein